MRGHERRAASDRRPQPGETPQARLLSRGCTKGLRAGLSVGLAGRLHPALSGSTAIYLLGLPGAELVGGEQRLAHRPYPGDGTAGGALCAGGGGRRAAASERPVRPYVSLGRVFDLTHARDVPTRPIRPRGTRRVTPDGSAASHGLDERFAAPRVALPIVLDERIDEQPAVDATVSDHIRREFRLSLFDHQPLAFLTSHRAPPRHNDESPPNRLAGS
ncbi:hypothetical protein NITMOv2_4801 [Nitrospira moscoviensis]|uniref:Uncharacterized protein n=1 Tax=Nitrospira moscoviensis TaxID=42253 RepID=A0A0K2GJY6_NITMO|nr:hypothetical protein NITMOv2_4801 [Nitrospira moscoviensis]